MQLNMSMKIKDITSGQILYYPEIVFQDETWLKAALCVWDKVHRIVPGTYVPNDSDEVKRAVAAGLVESIKLSPADLGKTAEQFEAFWDSIPMTPAGVTGYESVDLHADKVDARILPLLTSLAKIVKENGFLSLSPEVANSYMLFPAQNVSENRRIAKLTDSSDMFALMHYFANRGQFDEFHCNPEAKEATTALTLPSLLPGGLEYVAMDRVLEFRSRNEQLRASYRETVAETAEHLVGVENESHAREILKAFEEKLRLHHGQWTTAAKSFGLDIAHGFMAVGFPTSLTAMGTILSAGAFVSVSTIVGSLAIGSVATIADAARSFRSHWKQPDALYHLKLQNTFGDGPSLERVIRRYDSAFNEFIND
jgi:hypothetical protein